MRVGSRHMGFYRWPGLGQRHAPFASQLTLSHRLPGGSLPLIRANPPHTRVSRSSPVVQDDARRACFWGLASFLSGPSPGAGAVWQRERLAICPSFACCCALSLRDQAKQRCLHPRSQPGEAAGDRGGAFVLMFACVFRKRRVLFRMVSAIYSMANWRRKGSRPVFATMCTFSRK